MWMIISFIVTSVDGFSLTWLYFVFLVLVLGEELTLSIGHKE
jgi:hypothetical protein